MENIKIRVSWFRDLIGLLKSGTVKRIIPSRSLFKCQRVASNCNADNHTVVSFPDPDTYFNPFLDRGF